MACGCGLLAVMEGGCTDDVVGVLVGHDKPPAGGMDAEVPWVLAVRRREADQRQRATCPRDPVEAAPRPHGAGAAGVPSPMAKQTRLSCPRLEP